jgi:hypothetical protein
MALTFYIRKCLVAEKRPDGAVSDRRSAKGSSSFFDAPLPSLCKVFENLWVKFCVLREVCCLKCS